MKDEYAIALESHLHWLAEFGPKQDGWRYHSYAELILDRGEWCRTGDRVRPPGLKKGRDKQCYTNAFWVAISNPGLTYVEGYAVPQVVTMPMEHAWCVDEAGVVVETTWKTLGRTYLGMRFTTEQVQRSALETKMYGVLGSDYARDFKLLRTGEV